MLAEMLARPIAHRGLHACGAAGPVENTIDAAHAAIAAGYGIECDVQLTGDGQVVVFHDEMLDRLAGVPGRVGDMPLARLTAPTLLDGSRIPDLACFLAAIAGRAPLFIEIKSAGDGDMRLADAVLDHVRDYAGPVALESFDPLVLTRCRGASCPVGLVGPSDSGAVSPADIPRCDFLSWDIAHVAIAAAGHPRLPLTTWTVRDARQHALAQACRAQIVFEGFLA